MTTPTGELTGVAKLAYKPFGTVFGILGGLLSAKVFGIIWKKISKEPETPAPLSEDYSTREVLIAATIQGAVFGLIKTAVDRYGMKGVRRFLDAPRPSSAERKLAAAKAAADDGAETVAAKVTA